MSGQAPLLPQAGVENLLCLSQRTLESEHLGFLGMIRFFLFPELLVVCIELAAGPEELLPDLFPYPADVGQARHLADHVYGATDAAWYGARR